MGPLKDIRPPAERKHSRTSLSRMDRLSLIVTPIWDRNMGKRLELARMKRGISQGELAKDLSTADVSVSQQQVSAIETGKQKVLTAPFSLARLVALFGADAEYILFGTFEDKYANPGAIKTAYWHKRLKREKGESVGST